MSLADYEDFYFAACLADQDDPVAAWRKQSEEVERLRDWIQGREEVHITGPGTDIKLGIAGRTFIAADGKHNMPDGEFFTGPVETATEGEITFHLPSTVSGREVAGVWMRFEGGKVVDAQRRSRRGVPDQDPRHRRGRPPPRRARHRHQLRDRVRHEGDPARREDRRHRPSGRRQELSRDRRHQRVGRALGHDLRPPQGRQDHGRRRGHGGRRQVRRLTPGRRQRWSANHPTTAASRIPPGKSSGIPPEDVPHIKTRPLARSCGAPPHNIRAWPDTPNGRRSSTRRPRPTRSAGSTSRSWPARSRSRRVRAGETPTATPLLPRRSRRRRTPRCPRTTSSGRSTAAPAPVPTVRRSSGSSTRATAPAARRSWSRP